MGRTTKTKQPHNLLRNADGQKDASEEQESCKINLQPKRPFAVLVVFWLVAHRVRCGHEPYSTLSRLDLAEFHDFWVRRCMQDHIGLLDYIHHFSTLITKLNHHFDQLTTWVHCLLHGADHTALWWTMIWQKGRLFPPRSPPWLTYPNVRLVPKLSATKFMSQQRYWVCT